MRRGTSRIFENVLWFNIRFGIVFHNNDNIFVINFCNVFSYFIFYFSFFAYFYFDDGNVLVFYFNNVNVNFGNFNNDEIDISLKRYFFERVFV